MLAPSHKKPMRMRLSWPDQPQVQMQAAGLAGGTIVEAFQPPPESAVFQAEPRCGEMQAELPDLRPVPGVDDPDRLESRGRAALGELGGRIMPQVPDPTV